MMAAPQHNTTPLYCYIVLALFSGCSRVMSSSQQRMMWYGAVLAVQRQNSIVVLWSSPLFSFPSAFFGQAPWTPWSVFRDGQRNDTDIITIRLFFPVCLCHGHTTTNHNNTATTPPQ